MGRGANALRPVYSPTVDAYADFVATGEIVGFSAKEITADQDVIFTQDYLRYRMSAYNISNSVGLHIGYFIYAPAPVTGSPYFYAPALQTGGKWLFESHARDVLRYNARMPYRETIHYNRNGVLKDFYQSLVEYWKLEPANEISYLDLLYSGKYASTVFGHKGGQHLVGDFDKDGKDDIAFFEPGDESSWGSNSMYIRTHSPYSVWGVGQLQDFHPGLWHPFPGWLYEWLGFEFLLPGGRDGQFYIGDFNGDKTNDFAFLDRVTTTLNEDILAISTLLRDTSAPSGYKPEATWGFLDKPKDSLLFVGNGRFIYEAMDHFAFFDLSRNEMILANRFGDVRVPFPFSRPPYNYRIDEGQFYIGDFDGNGGDDIAFFASDNSMHISPHSASGFAIGREWGPNAFGHKYGKFYIGDFDGDGRSDFAFFEPGDNSLHILLNKIRGFTAGTGWGSNVFGNKEGELLVGDFNGDGKSDFAFLEAGPASCLPPSCTPYYTRIYTRLTLDNINSIVKFNPVRATYKTTSDTAGCPTDYKWKFSFEAQLRPGKNIADITVEVKTLTKPNLLLNADNGPGVEGARLTVPLKDGYSDGLLTTPYEYVDVPFTICLKERVPFSFYVDVLGTIKQ